MIRDDIKFKGRETEFFIGLDKSKMIFARCMGNYKADHIAWIPEEIYQKHLAMATVPEFRVGDKVRWISVNTYEMRHGSIIGIDGDTARIERYEFEPDETFKIYRHDVWLSGLWHDEPDEDLDLMVMPVPDEPAKKGYEPDGFDPDAFREFMRTL